MRASTGRLDWLRRYYALVDAGDIDGASSFFSEDATIRVAHNPAVRGRIAIAKVMRAGLAGVEGVRHEVTSAYEEDDGTLAFEVDVTYTLKDGTEVRIPGSAFCRLEGDRFTDQRLYADFAPVFGRREP